MHGSGGSGLLPVSTLMKMGVPVQSFINSSFTLFTLVSPGTYVGGFVLVYIVFFAPVFLFLKK